MATPANITIEGLTGTWVMDKSLSPDADPMLVLQGISWIVRKAIKLATVTLQMKQHLGANPVTSAPTVQIDIIQSTGTGLGGTSDSRFLDWSELPGEDHIFGKSTVQSRFVTGKVSSDGKARPDVDVQTKIDDPNIAKFLRGEIGDDLQPSEGYLVEKAESQTLDVNGEAGLWAQIVISSQDGKWVAEQVWGFEMVNNERRYVRRTVVSDSKGKFQLGRLVYSYRE